MKPTGEWCDKRRNQKNGNQRFHWRYLLALVCSRAHPDYVMNSFPGIRIGLLLVDRFAIVLAVFAGLALVLAMVGNLRDAALSPRLSYCLARLFAGRLSLISF